MKVRSQDHIQTVFTQALARPSEERAAFLDVACEGDAALRAEVESLLKSDSAAPTEFLQPPDPDVHGSGMAVDPNALIGQRLGRYTIESVIDRGGMGTVYLARQDRPRRPVALKVLGMGLASRSALRRFEYESQILAHLRHPNIAQVYEAGIHSPDPTPDPQPPIGAIPYFAMEFVPDARSLTTYAEDHGLSTRDRLDLFADVCDAVHYGHQKGVIHRDLKPANILVSNENPTDKPSDRPRASIKIIDFGVARSTDADIAITTMHTDVGQLIGTLHYMSPEQCAADPNDLDTRSDVYSLGVVLYELLCGRLPYDIGHATIQSAARTICETPPERPSTIDRRLRGDVETIALKALEKDRSRRYQSAAELVNDIRNHLKGEPITASPPTAWTRATRWITRHPIAATTAACLTIAVLTIIATKNYVWWNYERPHEIARYQSGLYVDSHDRGACDEARLLAVSGNILHAWGGATNSIAFAELVDRPTEFGGGKLALIGYNESHTGSLQKALCAYDVNGDLDVPRWQCRIETKDVLQELQDNRGFVGKQFSIQSILIEDIFPDPEHSGDEMVLIFRHIHRSQRVIRIYDTTGTRVLYEVWHDGAISHLYWMSMARLLVFAGDNHQNAYDEQGNRRENEVAPLVVFALRPEPGYTDAKMLDSGKPGDDPLSPVWYKCLYQDSVPVTYRMHDLHMLNTPPFHDARRFVRFSMRIHNKIGGVSWVIDEYGNEVTRLDENGREDPFTRIVNGPYQANQLLHDDDPEKLPDPYKFHLGEMPKRVE